jgi:hypothetical protein
MRQQHPRPDRSGRLTSGARGSADNSRRANTGSKSLPGSTRDGPRARESSRRPRATRFPSFSRPRGRFTPRGLASRASWGMERRASGYTRAARRSTTLNTRPVSDVSVCQADPRFGARAPREEDCPDCVGKPTLSCARRGWLCLRVGVCGVLEARLGGPEGPVRATGRCGRRRD